MKVIASTDEYTIYQRRDGRYAVKGADKKPKEQAAKPAETPASKADST